MQRFYKKEKTPPKERLCIHFIENNTAQIRYMAVEDDFRGKGVGKLITNEFIKISKEKNIL